MLIIANEGAGQGRGARVLDAVRPLLPTPARVLPTMCPGDARVLAARAGCQGEELIVALGGDGTANEVANGIADAGFRACLGIIPGGRGNDFAFALGLPPEPAAAVKALLSGQKRVVDVASLSVDGGPPRLYLNTFGMAASGYVAHLAQSGSHKGGTYSYAASLMKMLFRIRPWPFEVETAGGAVCHEAVYGQIANGRREGRLFMVAPDARLDDGLLDMLVVTEVPLLQRPWFVLRGGSGRLPPGDNVIRSQVAAAVVRAHAPLPCHIDGEPFTLAAGSEARVEALPARLTVLAPATSGR